MRPGKETLDGLPLWLFCALFGFAWGLGVLSSEPPGETVYVQAAMWLLGVAAIAAILYGSVWLSDALMNWWHSTRGAAE